MPKLGINIDHVATVREARRTIEPDPIEAAKISEAAGCHSIVAHLRHDRRHINEIDVTALRKNVHTRFNLEMSILDEIVDIACKLKPDQATLVPEKRQELTTEGGLDVVKNKIKIKKVIDKLKKHGILVSLFIDPKKEQIELSNLLGAESIELHTGEYANTSNEKEKAVCLKRLVESTRFGLELGLIVNAGHGLTYNNVRPVANIQGIEELNIGHSIISRAVLVGLEKAVKEMLGLIS